MISDAFALIFLVHGQAPVILQKLEHGRTTDEWNYYHRDLQALTRYLTRTFERLCRWQRIPEDAGLREMQDAPILYISGQGELHLQDATLARIRRYIDRGGTVFLHADRASKDFTRSVTTVFERLFRDLDYRFKPLDESHPIFSCHFDCRQKKRKKGESDSAAGLARRARRVPLQAIADGPRLLVLLCPVDIAGAWHQERLGKYPGLFQIMANVRTYTAPPHGNLPTRLRADPLAGPAAEPRGRLSLCRFDVSAFRRFGVSQIAHPGAWQRFADGLSHRCGIELTVSTTPSPFQGEGRGEGPTTDDLTGFDVVHLTTRRARQLPAHAIAALRAYLKGGGLLLIDAADGQPAGIAAVSKRVDMIDVGARGVLTADHPIATGAVPGGRPLVNLETTKAGSSLTRGDAPPPILTRTIDGRVAVIACPFDLIAAVDGHFVWNRSGYRPTSTARLVDNILLWRLSQIAPEESQPPD